LFADRSARAVRINIKHLPRAIDHHSKLAHLPRAEQAIDMREPANCGEYAIQWGMS
jgi:hypothetical protein